MIATVIHSNDCPAPALTEHYAPSMRSRNRLAPALIGMTFALITLTACSEGPDQPDTDVAPRGDATSTQSPDADLPIDQTGSPDVGSSGHCVTLGDNLSYDELTASMPVPYGVDPEQFRNLVEATPSGGHEKFLNDYCAVTVAGYGADDSVSKTVLEFMSTMEETRLSAIHGAYDDCLSVQANRSPSETFEPDPPGVVVLPMFEIANEDICPQIAFPHFPS